MIQLAKHFMIGLIIGMIAGFFLFGCWNDDYEPDNECIAGNFTCEDGMVMICGVYEFWEVYQDCESAGMDCSERADQCSGYYGIACCY